MLKVRIQEELPRHPPPEAQRLIFAGRLCTDDKASVRELLVAAKRDPTDPKGPLAKTGMPAITGRCKTLTTMFGPAQATSSP